MLDQFKFVVDENAEPYRAHVGMRTVKTVVAVFLCGLTGFLRGEVPMFAMIAAVLCMQNSADQTLQTAFNRILGTLVGGFFGVLLVFVCYETWLADNVLLYYLLISVALIPVISVTLMMKKPSMTALTCVVFLGTAIAQAGEGVPLYYSMQRVVDTMVGIVVTVGVDRLLPYHNIDEEENTEQPQADAEPESAPAEGPQEDTAARPGDESRPAGDKGTSHAPAPPTGGEEKTRPEKRQEKN